MVRSMDNLIKVRKVAQDVLLFVLYNRGGLDSEPPPASNVIPEISVELMNNLSNSVLIQSFHTLLIWDDFFKNHFVRMTSSLELFVKYVAYVFCILNNSSNAFESFFDTLLIISEFSLRCLEEDRKEYVHTCVDLFCTFYKEKIYQKFEEQGGWMKFDEYIRKQHESVQSKSIISNPKKPPNLVFHHSPEELERSNRLDRDRIDILKKKQPYVVNEIVLKDITRNQVENDENAVNFVESIELEELNQRVEEDFDRVIRDFEREFHQLRSEEAKWNAEEIRWEDRREKDCSSQEVQYSPGGIKSQREIEKKRKSSAGIKNQVVQRRSWKGGNPPHGEESKGAVKKAGQYSDVLKNKVPPRFSRKGENHSHGIPSVGAVKKAGQYPDGMKIQVLQRPSGKGGNPPHGEESKGAVKKAGQYSDVLRNQVSPRFSRNGENPSHGIRSTGAVKKAGQAGKQASDGIFHSDGMKNQVEQYPSRKNENPSHGIQSIGAVKKAGQYSDGMKNQVTFQCPSLKGENSPDGMQSKGAVKKAGQYSDGMKNQVEQYPSRKNENPSHGIQSIGAVKKAGQYSDGMKIQVLQRPSGKSGNPPHGEESKGAVKKAGQYPDGMKNQVEQHPSRKGENSPDGIQRQEALAKGHNESSDGMKSEESEWKLVGKKKKLKKDIPHPPCETESKLMSWERDKRSSDGMKHQVKQCSSNEDQKPSDPRKIKEAQEKKYPESSDGMKNQVKQSSSNEDRKPPVQMQGKEEEREKYLESSDGMKNQVKQYLLNDKKLSEIVSCKIEVAKTEHEVGTVIDQVSVKIQNLDTINSPQLRPAGVTPAEASHIKLNSTKMETIKKLLGDISLAFAKNCEIIHSECEKYGVQVPEHLKRKL